MFITKITVSILRALVKIFIAKRYQFCALSTIVLFYQFCLHIDGLVQAKESKNQ